MPLATTPLETRAKPAAKLTLGPGDQLEIKFAYAGQFNETQTIRPDGKIDLQLVGEIMAQGKTPAELRDELTKLYAVELQHPELALMVKSFYNQKVFVGGEVKEPGVIEMPAPLTALQAIMHAGGFNMETARVESVVVIRTKDGYRHGYLLNLKDSLKSEDQEAAYLQPMDIVYVPRTRVVDADQWVEQHVWKLLPNFGLGYGF